MTVLKSQVVDCPAAEVTQKIGDSWDNQNPDMSVIEEALEQGYNTERIDATLRLEAGWIDHHRHLKEGNESDNHVRGKVALAAYLDQAGYELETIENDWPVDEYMPYDETRDYVYTGASFEYRRFPGRVRPDVALPAHHIYGEVGNTPKKRLQRYLLSELDLELFLVPYTRHEVLERFEKHRYSFYHLRP